MTEQDNEQLLETLFGGDELAQVRAASLSRGLQEMRRKRRRAVAARASMIVGPMLLLTLIVFYPKLERRPPTSTPGALALAAKPESKVEYINAEELFALFPKRAMVLVGAPGHQKLVFLDEQR